MLEIRPNCEHCGKSLPSNSTDAMICSFECTYCTYCAAVLFENVCPSCGGDFQPRPIRPKVMLKKYPSSTKEVLDRKTQEKVDEMKAKYVTIKPEER
ncbi:DUF1272 domain-containing protein [uncultured Croceitalea sp.]|uniref:DUF1272 domain-containing protein n=1 Tax=uncultured Croceitalea sp. TaxID=1798908 RepID=UPI003305E9B9